MPLFPINTDGVSTTQKPIAILKCVNKQTEFFDTQACAADQNELHTKRPLASVESPQTPLRQHTLARRIPTTHVRLRKTTRTRATKAHVPHTPSHLPLCRPHAQGIPFTVANDCNLMKMFANIICKMLTKNNVAHAPASSQDSEA